MKSAFSSLSMLIALAIVGVLAAIMLPAYKNLNSPQMGTSSINQQSVEEKVDDMVKEIEMRKQQTVEYYNNLPE